MSLDNWASERKASFPSAAANGRGLQKAASNDQSKLDLSGHMCPITVPVTKHLKAKSHVVVASESLEILYVRDLSQD